MGFAILIRSLGWAEIRHMAILALISAALQICRLSPQFIVARPPRKSPRFTGGLACYHILLIALRHCDSLGQAQ